LFTRFAAGVAKNSFPKEEQTSTINNRAFIPRRGKEYLYEKDETDSDKSDPCIDAYVR
jgi:hypothetical protein